MRTLVLLAVCLSIASRSVAGEAAAGVVDPAMSPVWNLLASQEQASGEFRQELYDEEGDLVELSQGRYAILRPGYFRWEIDEPDRQEITVADGVLWHYDLDLATATSRQVGAEEQFTALDLLARDSAELAERFTVETLDDQHFRLLPRFPRAGFSAVELSWSEGELTAMTVERRDGQTLSLDLKPELNPRPLAPEDFEFRAPEGVEVQRAGGF